MTGFDDRESKFENEFAHNQELEFRAHARRSKLFGLWAAHHTGLCGVLAEEYASKLVQAFKKPDGQIVDQVLGDLLSSGYVTTREKVVAQLQHFGELAQQQIKTGTD